MKEGGKEGRIQAGQFIYSVTPQRAAHDKEHKHDLDLANPWHDNSASLFSGRKRETLIQVYIAISYMKKDPFWGLMALKQEDEGERGKVMNLKRVGRKTHYG